MPTRFILSAYAGPMPRPVVPICRLPRKRSVTLSSVRWYGMIRWALALTSSREASTPRASSASISLEEHLGSMTTPLPMTGVHVGVRMPDGQQVQRVLLAADDDGVAGVVAALEADDVVDVVAEQVGDLALALVAPLGADQHDRGHAVSLGRARARRCRARAGADRLVGGGAEATG